MKYIFNTVLPLDPSGKNIYLCTFEVGSIYKAIIQPYSSHTHGSAIVFSYSLGADGIFYYVKKSGTLKRYTTTWSVKEV